MRTTDSSGFLGSATVAAGLLRVLAIGLVAAWLPAQAPTTLEAGADCTTRCHQDLKTGKVLHEPSREGSCTDCHMQADDTKHQFAAIEDIGGMCRLCHQIELKAVVHSPFTELDCTGCHDPHRSDVEGLLVAPDQPTLCANCHDETVAKIAAEFPHGPATLGECTLCHDPHTAPEQRLLQMETLELCGSCHEDSVHDVENADYAHAPATMDCALCHDPHGSGHQYSLKAERRELCLSCHDEVKEHIGGATLVHGALSAERDCLGCHQPHAAKFPKLLTGSVKDNCLGCHTEPIARDSGKPVVGVGADIANKKFLHGPIREGDCAGCHQPHASNVQDLLLREYPARFYAPYKDGDYELCFGCHERKVFETENASTLTNFRDGDRNLHLLHVNRKDKGRTCRACHEPHGSNLPFHLAEAVPFGRWSLPINYVQAASGGSCQPGCHKLKSYDHGESLLPEK